MTTPKRQITMVRQTPASAPAPPNVEAAIRELQEYLAKKDATFRPANDLRATPTRRP